MSVQDLLEGYPGSVTCPSSTLTPRPGWRWSESPCACQWLGQWPVLPPGRGHTALPACASWHPSAHKKGKDDIYDSLTGLYLTWSVLPKHKHRSDLSIPRLCCHGLPPFRYSSACVSHPTCNYFTHSHTGDGGNQLAVRGSESCTRTLQCGHSHSLSIIALVIGL